MSNEIIEYVHGHDKCVRREYIVNNDFCTGGVEIACKICGFILKAFTEQEVRENWEIIRSFQRASYRAPRIDRYKYVLEKKD